MRRSSPRLIFLSATTPRPLPAGMHRCSLQQLRIKDLPLTVVTLMGPRKWGGIGPPLTMLFQSNLCIGSFPCVPMGVESASRARHTWL